MSSPQLTFIFFRGVGQPPTSYRVLTTINHHHNHHLTIIKSILTIYPLISHDGPKRSQAAR